MDLAELNETVQSLFEEEESLLNLHMSVIQVRNSFSCGFLLYPTKNPLLNIILFSGEC